MTKKEIMAKLTAKGIEFNPNVNKKELVALLPATAETPISTDINAEVITAETPEILEETIVDKNDLTNYIGKKLAQE